MPLSPEDLESFLVNLFEKNNELLTVDSILRQGKIPRRFTKSIDEALSSLQTEGLITQVQKAWIRTSHLTRLEGIVDAQSSGVLLAHSYGGLTYMPVHPAHLDAALPGDCVRIIVIPGKRKNYHEGQIDQIISRNQKEFIVAAHQKLHSGQWLCVFCNEKIPGLFLVHQKPDLDPIKKGDLLLITPEKNIGSRTWQGTVHTNLSAHTSMVTQELITKINHDIPRQFPMHVLTESATFPSALTPADWVQRKDLRDLDFISIDDETAKDCDDAIYVEHKHASLFKAPSEPGPEKEQYRLYVAIADVSHYAALPSSVSSEAAFRGNSYYFPLSVEPMLPENLANNLCSLQEGKQRLVLLVELSYDENGNLLTSTIYEALIINKKRLTYTEFQQAILLQEPEAKKKLAKVEVMLTHAFQLAKLLEKQRRLRGTLEFDLPEAQIVFNDDETIHQIIPREKHFGHKLIEEFMIAANESVANFLTKKKIPVFYRIHPAPDEKKLAQLAQVLCQFTSFSSIALLWSSRKKRKMFNPPNAAQLQDIITETTGSECGTLIHRAILRTMMQAKYSTENTGHYGLASNCYCHFTAPIRRYADLLVHHAVKYALKNSKDSHFFLEQLKAVEEHLNQTERIAVNAEREIYRRAAIIYLKNKIGQVFKGTISGVAEFGFFVELETVLTEGLVPVSSLSNDFYAYIPDRQELLGHRSGHRFHLGQKLTVRLVKVSLQHLSITFQFIEQPNHSNKLLSNKKKTRPYKKRPKNMDRIK